MRGADLPFSILGTYYVFTASELGEKMSMIAMLSTISSSVMVPCQGFGPYMHAANSPYLVIQFLLQLGVKLCKLPALKALLVNDISNSNTSEPICVAP